VPAKDDAGPRPLHWSLRQVAARVRRVDLVGLGAIESIWPSLDAARRCEAVPVKVIERELTVAVPTGAHAARARRDATAILEELSTLVSDAPATLRVIVRVPEAPSAE
jgi:hypothetical protein